MMMVTTRCLELTTEAVPGLILQCVALISAESYSPAIMASLFLSAGSAAMITTSIFYDTDVNPDTRSVHPECGLIHDQRRNVGFASSMAFHFCHVLSRGFATALIALTSVKMLAAYTALDVAVYFLCVPRASAAREASASKVLLLVESATMMPFPPPPPPPPLTLYCARRYKIIRRDFMVAHLPMSTCLGLALSAVVRLFIDKLLLDLTGSLNNRVPFIAGGSYYAFAIAENQALVLVAAWTFKDGELFGVGVGLVAANVLSLGVFVLAVANEEKIKYLWSGLTGKQRCWEQFFRGEDEETKSLIFSKPRSLWEAEIGAEVRAWTMSNWATWEEEHPQWFVPAFIAHVPETYIPADSVQRLSSRSHGHGNVGSVRDTMNDLSELRQSNRLSATKSGNTAAGIRGLVSRSGLGGGVGGKPISDRQRQRRSSLEGMGMLGGGGGRMTCKKDAASLASNWKRSVSVSDKRRQDRLVVFRATEPFGLRTTEHVDAGGSVLSGAIVCHCILPFSDPPITKMEMMKIGLRYRCVRWCQSTREAVEGGLFGTSFDEAFCG
jgi:hypothetical protein